MIGEGRTTREFHNKGEYQCPFDPSSDGPLEEMLV